MTAAPLVEAARRAGVTIATAESLTGGGVSQAITAVPGSSEVFVGSVVSYASRIKIELLGLSPKWEAEHGVVNSETACQMAKGVLELMRVDLALSTTGVAGPDSQDNAAVGEVWIGLALRTAEGIHTEASRHFFVGNRDEIRSQTVTQSIDLLTKTILTVHNR